MRYIDESLAPGEEILHRGEWPKVFWVGAWAALLFLGIILVGVFIFVRSLVVMKSTDFAVTNRRVILKSGWLNRRTQELAVESIEGVSLEQTLIARMFGYGHVVVTGTGDAVIRFPAMSHPVAFRRSIEAARAESTAVHLERSDREALDRAVANDTATDDADTVENVEQQRRQRPRKRSSFIGLRSRH